MRRAGCRCVPSQPSDPQLIQLGCDRHCTRAAGSVRPETLWHLPLVRIQCTMYATAAMPASYQGGFRPTGSVWALQSSSPRLGCQNRAEQHSRGWTAAGDSWTLPAHVYVSKRVFTLIAAAGQVRAELRGALSVCSFILPRGWGCSGLQST